MVHKVYSSFFIYSLIKKNCSYLLFFLFFYSFLHQKKGGWILRHTENNTKIESDTSRFELYSDERSRYRHSLARRCSEETMNRTERKVTYGSNRSTSQLVDRLMHNHNFTSEYFFRSISGRLILEILSSNRLQKDELQMQKKM